MAANDVRTLLTLCINGDVETIAKVFTKELLHVTHDNGDNLLEVACRYGHNKLALFFLENFHPIQESTVYIIIQQGNIELFCKTYELKQSFFHDHLVEKKDILFNSIQSGNYQIVSTLLSFDSAKQQIQSLAPTSISSCHIACLENDTEKLTSLLNDLEVSPNLADENGMTVLVYAAILGLCDIVEVLLADKRIDPNIPFVVYEKTQSFFAIGEGKFLPLHYACYYGHKQVVDLLIADSRVNINQASAFEPKAPVIDDFMLSKGHSKPIKHESTPLYFASKGGHASIVQALLENPRLRLRNLKEKISNPGRRRNAIPVVDHSRITVPRNSLHVASCYGHVDVCKTLLHDSRFDISLASSFGGTALNMAINHGRSNVVEYLLSFPSRAFNFEVKLAAGTLFLNACCSGNVNTVRMLLDDPRFHVDDERIGNSMIPLRVAYLQGYEQMVNLLLSDKRVGSIFTEYIHSVVRTATSLHYFKYIVQKGNELYVACAVGDQGAVQRAFQSSNCDVNFADSEGITSLHIAAAKENLQILSEILQHSSVEPNKLASPMDEMVKGRRRVAKTETALLRAVKTGKTDAVRMLLSHDRISLSQQEFCELVLQACRKEQLNMVILFTASARWSENLTQILEEAFISNITWRIVDKILPASGIDGLSDETVTQILKNASVWGRRRFLCNLLKRLHPKLEGIQRERTTVLIHLLEHCMRKYRENWQDEEIVQMGIDLCNFYHLSPAEILESDDLQYIIPIRNSLTK